GMPVEHVSRLASAHLPERRGERLRRVGGIEGEVRAVASPRGGLVACVCRMPVARAEEAPVERKSSANGGERPLDPGAPRARASQKEGDEANDPFGARNANADDAGLQAGRREPR